LKNVEIATLGKYKNYKNGGFEMNKELKKEIIDYLYENENLWQRANKCREEFKEYIYNKDGNYLIGGEMVSNFIEHAEKLLYKF